MSADQTPVCPASKGAVDAFLTSRHGGVVLPLTDRWLTSRARMMSDLREGGRLRDAERFGWLSLAGVCVGMTSARALEIEPSSSYLHVSSGPSDLLPVPLGKEVEVEVARIPGIDLVVSMVPDDLGFQIFVAAAASRTSAMVTLGDRQIGEGAFASALTDRLAAMAVDDGGDADG